MSDAQIQTSVRKMIEDIIFPSVMRLVALGETMREESLSTLKNIAGKKTRDYAWIVSEVGDLGCEWFKNLAFQWSNACRIDRRRRWLVGKELQ
mmetsp:Transcript_17242/g.39853  ORF Transcript_17242/g.39853 Transcript_17242/m.39853 type:complete len:93 (+) Transcript_17242:3-281(+)